jgi:WD40 repeat protein
VICGWTLDSGEELFRVKAHDGEAAMAVSPDGKHLVSGGRDKKLCLWDARSGKQLLTQTRKRGDKAWDLGISSLVFSEAGRTVYTTGRMGEIFGDFSIWKWDLAEKGEGQAFLFSNCGATCIVAQPTAEKYIVGTSNGRIDVLSLGPDGSLHSKDGARETNLESIACLAASPDGKWIAAGSNGICLLRCR